VKYIVDSALCAAHGLCAETAPDVFSLDEDGFNTSAGVAVEVPEHLEDAARRGASACPESAIQIQ
jgi:ferredoxin